MARTIRPKAPLGVVASLTVSGWAGKTAAFWIRLVGADVAGHQGEGLAPVGADEDADALEGGVEDVEVARRGAGAGRVEEDVGGRGVLAVDLRDHLRRGSVQVLPPSRLRQRPPLGPPSAA